MPGLFLINMPEHLTVRVPAGSLVLNANEIVPCLVGHTIEEIERELILDTLIYHCGNRSHAADVLGISIRTLRNKIHEYETQGIAVLKHGQPRMTGPAPRVPKPHKH
jgi:DNA-binding NtrC family response regulator